MGWNEESYFRINNEQNMEMIAQKRSVTIWDSFSGKAETQQRGISFCQWRETDTFTHTRFSLTSSRWYWCCFTDFNVVMPMWNCCNWSWLKFSEFFSSTQTTMLWIKNSWNKICIISILAFPFSSHFDMSEVVAVRSVQTSDWKIKCAVQKIIYC